MTDGAPPDDEFVQRLLIVDDEPVMREILAEALADFDADYVASGEEAIFHLENVRYGLLMCDKNLPGLGGLEVVRICREMQPYCACIIISGYSSTTSAIEALRLGATDYFEKPFDDVILVAERVRRCLELQRLAWERDRLLSTIRRFESELRRESHRAERQDAEIRMFNEILEARVRDASERLRSEIALLTGAVQEGRSVDSVLERLVRELLEHVHAIAGDLGFLDSAVSAAVHGSLSGIARRVENVLDLILLAQGKDVPVVPYVRGEPDD